MKKLLLTLMLTAQSAAFAESPTDKSSCDAQLDACDLAVESLAAAIDAKNLVINELQEQNKVLAKEANDARIEADSWYHSPFAVGVLGLAVGVLGGVWAAKH